MLMLEKWLICELRLHEQFVYCMNACREDFFQRKVISEVLHGGILEKQPATRNVFEEKLYKTCIWYQQVFQSERVFLSSSVSNPAIGIFSSILLSGVFTGYW